MPGGTILPGGQYTYNTAEELQRSEILKIPRSLKDLTLFQFYVLYLIYLSIIVILYFGGKNKPPSGYIMLHHQNTV